MKKVKLLLKILIITALVIITNGFYYVFSGQFKSAQKLKEGKELNLYECASIYSMHTALWMFAWPCSIAAANEVFMMQFSGKDVDTVNHTNKYILNSILSPKVINTMKSLSNGETKRVSYNGNVSYALNDPEHRAAMAINPCTITREDDTYVIRVNNTWPVHSETHIKIKNGFEIVLNEGLFRYLQDRGIIHNFVDEYRYKVEYINKLGK